MLNRLFKRRKWLKWQDVAIVDSNGNLTLLQVRECDLSGEKQYKQRRMGWVNDFEAKQEIKNKTFNKKD